MRPITPADSERLFAAMAALGDRIAFRQLAEGCECRSQLMIEEMLTMGVEPGRAWALATPGSTPHVADPLNPGRVIRWQNHTAPVVVIGPSRDDLRVIDPSLPGVCAPLPVREWADAIRLASFEWPEQPLTQAEMLALFAERATRGQPLRGFVYTVERGVSPVADIAGSGFRLGVDPPEGASVFARERMRDYLNLQALAGS